jgi:hypothetical protein
MKITLNNKTFELKFGFGVFFILGKLWKLDNFQDTLDKVKEAEKIGDEVKFEALEILCDVVKACIVNNKDNGVVFEDLDQTEVIEYLFENIDQTEMIFQGIVDSMPKPKESEKVVGK